VLASIHTPDTQTAFVVAKLAKQLLPQEPQLRASSCGLEQTPLQQLLPAPVIVLQL
jgi:hypothetical protein